MADELGIAVLFSGDPDTGKSTMDVFREGECGDLDPITAAEALRDSCAGDFPGRLWSFTGNDRAKDLRQAFLIMRVLG